MMVGSGSFSTPSNALKGSSWLSRSASASQTPPAAEAVEQLGHVDQGPVAFAPVRARVQRRLALDAFGQAKLLQQGGHGQLPAMHTGLVGVAEFNEKALGLERDEFGHARLDRPDRYFQPCR